jgi:eukaryotic-like serine/threonine-protein kinase
MRKGAERQECWEAHLKWSFATGNGDQQSSPAVSRGIVYIGSDEGIVYALNVNTGAELWRYYVDGFCICSSPAVAKGVVYVGSYDGNFYARPVTSCAPHLL